MAGMVMTKVQTEAVAALLQAFLVYEGRLSALHPALSLHIKVASGMIDADDTFEQSELYLLSALMEIYFEHCNEDMEIWPGLEQAYAKITGYHAYDTAWYVRAKNNSHLVGVFVRNRDLPFS